MQMNSGPPPKDPATRARRNKPPTSAVQLPENGREGPAPEWPVGTGPESDLEHEMWEQLWATPQAAAWERMGLAIRYEVAHYIAFTLRGRTANADLERRQISDRLGMNPLAMRRLGWEVKTPDIQTVQTPGTASNKRYEGLRAVAKTAEQ